MKVVKILIIIVLLFGATATVVHFGNLATKAKSDLNQERFLRLSAEEKLDKAKSDIESLKSDLSKSENKINVLEKQLEQKNIINRNLKMRLDKAIKIKESIEKRLADMESMVNKERILPINQ